MKKRPTLREVLQSTSDVLFPAELGKKAVEIHSVDVDGDTPLHVMVRREDKYAVGLLLEAGAPVSAVGDMGETPLHTAVRKGNVEIAELLLEAGADVRIRSEFRDTPAELAAAQKGAMHSLFKHYAG